MPKSLFEFIAEAIDEALPPNSGTTGREIYLLGWERYEQDYRDRLLVQRRKEIEKGAVPTR